MACALGQHHPGATVIYWPCKDLQLRSLRVADTLCLSVCASISLSRQAWRTRPHSKGTY